MAKIDYKCTMCGVEGKKLWRQYSTFADHIKLMCAECACKDQNEAGPVGDDGKRESEYGRTDQIGWMVPAIPDDEWETFWGYTSVPQKDVEWWKGLPT